MARRKNPVGLDALLASKEMVLVLGSGGVGKTTITAALGLAAAVEQGGRVLVLTVDPARRLADALGVGALGNVASRVPDEAFEQAGITPRGELWAAMLDTKAGWDELIRRHAPDAKVRDAVLANPLYQNITGRFVHSHDYLAMEQLHELHASGRYDLVVVDTPPSRNALSVLDAPAGCASSSAAACCAGSPCPTGRGCSPWRRSRSTRSPIGCSGQRLPAATSPTSSSSSRRWRRASSTRAREVEALLGDTRTTFVVVSTLETAPAHEAMFLARELLAAGPRPRGDHRQPRAAAGV